MAEKRWTFGIVAIFLVCLICLAGAASTVMAAPSGESIKPNASTGGDFSLTSEMLEGLGKAEWEYSRKVMKEEAKKDPFFGKALKNMKSQLKADPHKFYKDMGNLFVSRVHALERRLQKLVAECEEFPPAARAPCGSCEYEAWSVLINHNQVRLDDPVTAFVRPPLYSYTGGAIAFDACMKKLKKKRKKEEKQEHLCKKCDEYKYKAQELSKKLHWLAEEVNSERLGSVGAPQWDAKKRHAMDIKLRELSRRVDAAWEESDKCYRKLCPNEFFRPHVIEPENMFDPGEIPLVPPESIRNANASKPSIKKPRAAPGCKNNVSQSNYHTCATSYWQVQGALEPCKNARVRKYLKQLRKAARAYTEALRPIQEEWGSLDNFVKRKQELAGKLKSDSLSSGQKRQIRNEQKDMAALERKVGKAAEKLQKLLKQFKAIKKMCSGAKKKAGKKPSGKRAASSSAPLKIDGCEFLQPKLSNYRKGLAGLPDDIPELPDATFGESYDHNTGKSFHMGSMKSPASLKSSYKKQLQKKEWTILKDDVLDTQFGLFHRLFVKTKNSCASIVVSKAPAGMKHKSVLAIYTYPGSSR